MGRGIRVGGIGCDQELRLVSDNKEIPYRLKLRTPCLSNLSLFEEASQGMLLPDALAFMGSLDLVIPDIDR